MNDPERLAALLDDLHEHTGHNVSLVRCLEADCRELRELLALERVVWLSDVSPRRSMWAHQPGPGGLTIHGGRP